MQRVCCVYCTINTTIIDEDTSLLSMVTVTQMICFSLIIYYVLEHFTMEIYTQANSIYAILYHHGKVC